MGIIDGIEGMAARRARANARGASYNGKRTPEFRSWQHMIARCTSPSEPSYESYRARGITVCQEWTGAGGFDLFLAHVGKRPTPRHSIDRIDNDRGYEPGNVRWATPKEQALNRSTNRRITAFGETLCIGEWARRTGIRETLLRKRLRRLPPEAALSKPVAPRKRRALAGAP